MLRYCDCPLGYIGSILLLGAQEFGGCRGEYVVPGDTQALDFPECVYGCDPNSVCAEEKPNERTCTCNSGYNGSQTLIGSEEFLGCSGMMSLIEVPLNQQILMSALARIHAYWVMNVRIRMVLIFVLVYPGI